MIKYRANRGPLRSYLSFYALVIGLGVYGIDPSDTPLRRHLDIVSRCLTSPSFLLRASGDLGTQVYHHLS